MPGLKGQQGHDKAEDRELATLLSAAQAGDSGAYRALLTRLLPGLRSRLAGNEAEVQMALLRLHRLRATWRPGRRVHPWSGLIARPAPHAAAASPSALRRLARFFARRAGKPQRARV
jgi:hypothetical protein